MPRCCRAGAARRRSSARSRPATRDTGVCLMQMEEGLDTGPVLLRRRWPIGADETGGELHDRLAALGAQVLADGLGLLRAGMQPVAAAAARGRRDLRAQARQGRGAAGLGAAPRRAGRQGARVQPVADGRSAARRRARAHPCARSRWTTAHGATPGTLLARRPRRHRHRLRRTACCASARCSAKAARRSPPPTTSTRGSDLRERHDACADRSAASPGMAGVALARARAARVLDAVLHRRPLAEGRTGPALPTLADPRDRALVEAIVLRRAAPPQRYDAAAGAWMPRPLAGRDDELRAAAAWSASRSSTRSAAAACGGGRHRRCGARDGPRASGGAGQRAAAPRPARRRARAAIRRRTGPTGCARASSRLARRRATRSSRPARRRRRCGCG